MTPRWKWPDYSSLLLAVFNGFGVIGYASGRWQPERFSSAILSALVFILLATDLVERRARAWRDLRTKRTP